MIRPLGYDGSDSNLRMYISKLKKKSSTASQSKKTIEDTPVICEKTHIKLEKLQKILWREFNILSTENKELLNSLLINFPLLQELYTVTQVFKEIILHGTENELKEWVDNNYNSHSNRIRRFVIGVKKDINAISNTLKYKFTNGFVEGNVNRLKLIKRTMYGRANLPLLRQKVLFQLSMLD